MMVIMREEVKKKLEELKKEKNLTMFSQKFEELMKEVGTDLVHWSELEPMLHEIITKLLKLFELYEKEFKRIRQKQAEFETRLAKVEKKLSGKA